MSGKAKKLTKSEGKNQQPEKIKWIRSFSRGRGDREGDRDYRSYQRDFEEKGQRRRFSCGRGDGDDGYGYHSGNHGFVRNSERSFSRGRGDREGDRGC